MKHLAILVLAVCFLARPQLSAQELIPLTGTPTTGKLISVTPEAITFQSGVATATTYALKDIGAIDFKATILPAAKDLKYDLLELTDGSQIRAAQFKIVGKQVQFATTPAPEGGLTIKFELPLNHLFWMMRNPEDVAARDEFQKLLKTRGKRDLIVVKTSSGLNPISGTLLNGNETGDRFDFEREDGTKSALPLSRANAGLIFNQPSRDIVAPTLCKVIDRFGNLLFATNLELIGQGLRVKLVCGTFVEYSSLQAISKLDFSQGNLLYLSNLTPVVDYPAADKDGPLGEQFAFQPTLQNDKALFTPEIILDGKKYGKGVTLPRGASATYKLDGTFREFKAVAGILDGNNRETWAIRLMIDIDNRTVFNEVISKKQTARLLGLNIKDAKELRITVDSLGEYQGDQVNLAEARLQK